MAFKTDLYEFYLETVKLKFNQVVTKQNMQKRP